MSHRKGVSFLVAELACSAHCGWFKSFKKVNAKMGFDMQQIYCGARGRGAACKGERRKIQRRSLSDGLTVGPPKRYVCATESTNVTSL
jgi:hypothetical protein